MNPGAAIALLLAASNLPAATLYVSLESAKPTPPYANWLTAAGVIQDAVDAASAGDEIVVSNGIYASGGRAIGTNALVNRVAVIKPLTLRSVNGPSATVIRGVKAQGGYLGCGEGAHRCVSLVSGASLSGFTLTNGATLSAGTNQVEQSGGGLWCESQAAVVSNCVLTGNSAWYGGGACGCALNNCVLTNNSARYSGGGASGSALQNCVLIRNSARFTEGGGAFQSALYDCSLAGNLAALLGGGASSCALSNCALMGNSSGSAGGGASGSALTNCALTNNFALYFGGGVDDSALNNCALAGNSAASGGGADHCTLTNCALAGNVATGTNMWSGGGGAYQSTLDHCALDGNSAWNGGGAGGDPNDSGPSLLVACLLTTNTAQSGGGASACMLTSCTLSGNSATNYGGAASGCGLNYCALTGNSAGNDGGGASGGGMANCVLSGNVAGGSGGGAAYARLHNCALAGNRAAIAGGGAAFCWSLDSCIVYFNTATVGPNYAPVEYNPLNPMNYCCALPMPANGTGNITNAPLFVDFAGGNLRLQSNSPCINAGNNAAVTTATDLDGNPRIVSGAVDIGAYEYQGPGSVISYAWLQYYGLPTDGSADYADPDHDGLNNWQEWVCGTDPTDARSVLRLLPPSVTNAHPTVAWQSVVGLTYVVARSSNAAAPFTLLATNIPGTAGVTSYTDTNATEKGPFFYRVGVKAP